MAGPEHTKAVMCRTQDYKYVRRLYGSDELYDLKAGPMELTNRIDDHGGSCFSPYQASLDCREVQNLFSVEHLIAKVLSRGRGRMSPVGKDQRIKGNE